MQSAQALLRSLFAEAIAAVDPARCLPALLPPRPKGRTTVFALGKAAASMAAVVEQHWDGPLDGFAVARYGHGIPLKRIVLLEAGHPHADDAGADAARRMLAAAMKLEAADLALALISGGGSALTSLPAPGISADSKRRVLRDLLVSGAPIADINCVRRRLSAFKGGRLAAAAAPAHVHSIVISDIPGDDPALVASGPTFPDPAPLHAARELLARWQIALPADIAAFLGKERPAIRIARSTFSVAATAMTALQAAKTKAEAQGVRCEILSDRLEGEARDLGTAHAALACRRLGEGPVLLLSGGETSVTVTGGGRGGRNAEYLAALAIGIDGQPIAALAADTDGIDGSEDNAGAVADGTTVRRARSAGLDCAALLADNDAYHLFATLGDLVVTGPTRTNVNDFRAIFVGAT